MKHGGQIGRSGNDRPMKYVAELFSISQGNELYIVEIVIILSGMSIPYNCHGKFLGHNRKLGFL
jgi:hypothetical protein